MAYLTRIALAAVVLGSLVLPATAGDWMNWRGPSFNGSTEASNLPTDFDRTRGVRWSVPMPGSSGGTPIIVGDRVFVTSIDEAGQALMAYCIDRKSGQLLWKVNAFSGYRPNGDGTATQIDDYSNYASPSPVSDGNRVVFFFGNGDLVAFDLEGQKLWNRNIQADYGDFSFQWTFGASPTLFDGRLYLPVLQRDKVVHGRGKEGAESYLLALDPATGATQFKYIRKSDAQMESLESYGTVIPYKHEGAWQLLIAGGDCLSGHDPATGEELWRSGSWNPDHREQWWRLVPSPVAGAGIVLGYAPKRAPVYAAKIPSSAGATAPWAWESDGRRGVASDVPTPAFADGSFFVLNDQAPNISRVDPATGAPLWTTKLPGRHLYRGSPTVADGKVFTINYRGDVTIVDAADGSILNTVAMGTEDDNYTPSSIAVAHDQLFIRTQGHIFCVGQ